MLENFKLGRHMNISVALEEFAQNEGETKDFRVNYVFSFTYYDQTPLLQSNVLGFSVQ
jgi:hypothetical protein